MKVFSQTAVLAVIAGGFAMPALADAQSDSFGLGAFAADHAVFVMTNDADSNEVLAYERTPYGTLHSPRKFQTGGRGSGGTVDPLASQGSLHLSQDGATLFAANAGSGTVSVFRVFGSRLVLTDIEASGGSEPTAVAQHGNLVYVLNTAGSSSVVGFRVRDGKLTRIAHSLHFLSGNLANPGSIAFSADGKSLLVTEKATNALDVFNVLPDGTLAALVSTPSAGPGAFALNVAPNGTVVVSETGTSSPNSSGISSYSIGHDGHLVPISVSVPTLGAANCWNAFTPNGRFVYASNAGTSSISGFQLSAGGSLVPIGSTVVGLNPSGSANLDIAVSSDGKFLYSLNGGSGAVGMFAIASDGSLVSLGIVSGLPAGAGLNGIAAN
ncbi:MAG TPA: beta-propeller fold lactonase family protein [Steroidobacteraceae bacterium]|jgi:6-phosphogluconolactonase (cycloisomerase 2 family)